MVVFKEISTEVTQTGLYRIGYRYKSSIGDWLEALFNPISIAKLRFDVLSDERFSFYTIDNHLPSLFGKREKKKTLLVDLKSGESLTLKAAGNFRPRKIHFIIEEPGTFKE